MGFTPFGPPPYFTWAPADDGFAGANSDPSAASGGGLLIAQTLYLSRLPIRVPAAVTNLFPGLSVVGADTGTGTFFAGLYSAGGVLLSGSANLVASTTAGTGYKAFPLTTAQSLAGGPGPASWVWAAFLANLTTTQPTLLRQENAVFNSPQTPNNAATLRWGSIAAVGATLPVSIVMSNMTTTAFPFVVLWN
jgi:hypothetical protein